MRLPPLLLVTLLALSGCKAPAQPPGEAKAPLEAPKSPAETPKAPIESPKPEVPPAPPEEPAPPAPAQEEWTAGIVDVVREGAPITRKEIRAAKNDGFDRIVFVFEGEAVPGHHVEYIDRPAHHCGSGAPLEIPGDALLEVRLSPAVAHDESGRLTLASQELKPKLPIVLELEQSCDFEGVVSFVARVKSPHRYRVLELKDPARLVIDVRH